MRTQPKLYFFDAGVYRSIRPKGPLDAPEEIEGICLETLIVEEVRALNDYYDLGYQLYYWHAKSRLEVDLVLYGPKGILAYEVKRGRRVRPKQLSGLKAFPADYPMAKSYFLYGGTRRFWDGGIEIIPVTEGIKELYSQMKGGNGRGV